MLRTRVRAGPVTGLALSLVVAALLTLVQTGDRLVTSWAPNYGEKTTTALRVPYGPQFVRVGSRTRLYFEEQYALVAPGTRLDPQIPAHQSVYQFETSQRPPTTARLVSVFVAFFALVLALSIYLGRFGQNRLRLVRMQVGLMVAMSLLALVGKALLLFTAVPSSWVPMATVPLLVATAFDRRAASVVTVVLALVVASLAQFDLILLCVLLARGLTATLFYLDRKHPRQMVLAGFLAGLAAAGLHAAMIVAFEGRFDAVADLRMGLGSQLLACVGGGIGAGALGVTLRAPAERLLGNVPRERLLELQDLSQPLLRKLAKEAPGTFEHSRAMANLAEQAASAIHADALLTRVGAYYHDLGKTVQSKYFVENLLPDEPSPHDTLDPKVSAEVIMAHVVLGAQILREGRVPEPVVEFCYTHHGTSVIEYFWTKYQQHGSGKLTEAAFSYPGMKPQTKETGILMLVDSIEAASRTVDDPTRDQFQQLIQRIVFTKLQQGQLDDCGLDMAELRIITNRMTDTLVNMYHHRIKYQWQVKRAEEFGVPSEAVRASSPEIEISRMQAMAFTGDSEAPRSRQSEPNLDTGSSFPAATSQPSGPVRESAETSGDSSIPLSAPRPQGQADGIDGGSEANGDDDHEVQAVPSRSIGNDTES